MSRASNLLELISEAKATGLAEGSKYEDVQKAFEALLEKFDIGGVDISVDKQDGIWLVDFTDEYGESNTLAFGTDEDSCSYVILDNNDLDADEANTIDIDALGVTVAEDGSLDLTELSWLDKSTFLSFLNKTGVSEKFKTVVRGGKKVRIQVPTRKKRLTAKQKAARKLAGAKRRGKKLTGKAKRSRALSLKKRKSSGL